MKWPLGQLSLSFLDRLKVATFILNPANKLTQGDKVSELEKKMAEFVGVKYAVFVGNGSLANTLLAMYVKDHPKGKGRKEVILPALTWQTSCSPWIREGFKPVFLDIDIRDWSMDRDELIKYLNKNHTKVAAVFPTALLGFSPPMDFYAYLQRKYPDIYFMSDNCENTFGQIQDKNISSYLTSTTSTYIGHQLCSIEGGFVFTNNQEEAEYFIMARNHGMTRGLNSWSEPKYRNEKVDKRFDFYCMGSNFRNTEINALIGILDFKSVGKYMKHRRRIYELYYDMLRRIDPLENTYLHSKLPPPHSCHSPFCLPLVCNFESDKKSIMRALEEEYIETRPIISGFLGNQTAYKKYFSKNKGSFQKSKLLDSLGFYMGLHIGITERHINKLEKILKDHMYTDL